MSNRSEFNAIFFRANFAATFEKFVKRGKRQRKGERGIKATTKNHLNWQSCQMDSIKDSIHVTATALFNWNATVLPLLQQSIPLSRSFPT